MIDPRLASFLGGTKGYSIYRRFAALNARNLLYHQAKLTRLEHELFELEQAEGGEQDIHYKVSHVFDAERGSSEYKVSIWVEHVILEFRYLLEASPNHESCIQRCDIISRITDANPFC